MMLQFVALTLYNAVVPRSEYLEAVADLAEDQWGLFTRRQAEATGMAWTTLSRLASHGVAERVAHGVYRLRGTPPVDQLALRAAWLQLAPDTPVWERQMDQGVVSHRSAAALLGLGHLPADVHHFILPIRRQSRRADVALHRAHLDRTDWMVHEGLLVTTPARTAADLLVEREDLDAIAHFVTDALRAGLDQPGRVGAAIATYAGRLNLTPGDGPALLEWLLNLTRAPERNRWLKQARADLPTSGPAVSNGRGA